MKKIIVAAATAIAGTAAALSILGWQSPPAAPQHANASILGWQSPVG